MRSSAGSGSALSSDSMSRNWPEEARPDDLHHRQLGWVTRYLAEVSSPENSATARHISPIAFRRSAAGMATRAAAERRRARPPASKAAASVPVLSSMGGPHSAWAARRPTAPTVQGVLLGDAGTACPLFAFTMRPASSSALDGPRSSTRGALTLIRVVDGCFHLQLTLNQSSHRSLYRRWIFACAYGRRSGGQARQRRAPRPWREPSLRTSAKRHARARPARVQPSLARPTSFRRTANLFKLMPAIGGDACCTARAPLLLRREHSIDLRPLQLRPSRGV